MMRALALLLILALLPLTVGCGAFLGSNLDFAALLTCSTDRLFTTSDLRWSTFTATLPAEARPDTMIPVRMDVFAVGQQFELIGLPSNIRLFLSFDQTLDSNDYIVGEYTVNNLEARQPGQPVSPKILIEEFRVPRPTQPPTVPGFEDQYFPTVIPDPDASADPNYDPFDPARPEYIGPVSINYWIIAVLDSSNCIDEFSPELATREPATREDQRGAAPTAGSLTDPNINNQIVFGTQITVLNPNLPNLTIQFREIQPQNTPQSGGVLITDWEVLNTGLGPVLAAQSYDITVYLSEDEDFDSWDVLLTTMTFNGPLNPGGQAVHRITCQLPYTATRANTNATAPYQSAFDTASSITIPAGGYPPGALPRIPPPNGPPTVDMMVYPAIPNQNEVPAFLIAMVDSGDDIREQVEVDNFSNDEEGLNGTLSIRETPLGGGFFDLRAISLTAAVVNGVLEIRFQLESTTPNFIFVSIGYHLSEDAVASSADYFWNRFIWQTLGQGQQEAALFFPIGGVANIPAPIEWFFVGVLDDVLAIPETNDNNNFAIDQGSIRIQ